MFAMGRSSAEEAVVDALESMGLPFTKEYNVKCPEYERARRIDFYLHDHGVFVELDGEHHFENIGPNRPGADSIRRNDIHKMKTALQQHPGAVFVRIRSDDVIDGLCHGRGRIDFLGIVRGLALARKPADSGIVVFAESANSTHYDRLKSLMTNGEPWVSAHRTLWCRDGSYDEFISVTSTEFEKLQPREITIEDCWDRLK